MQKTFSISDLAREFGITTRTIRHYEEIGLIHPVRQGQTRVFSNSDRTRLKLIVRGRRLGLSLEESREIVDMYDPKRGNTKQLQKLLSKIRAQKDKLAAQLQDIDKLMAELNEAEQNCLSALQESARQ